MSIDGVCWTEGLCNNLFGHFDLLVAQLVQVVTSIFGNKERDGRFFTVNLVNQFLCRSGFVLPLLFGSRRAVVVDEVTKLLQTGVEDLYSRMFRLHVDGNKRAVSMVSCNRDL
ncbi:hypothetical protein GHT06_015711 [Daphnia sinensis]|uniref:Uncharacterized protein n=1 Tax=Daphnia sinensis TaxID=1820382 RepID=A0AAD5KTS5_9CRUS|nr:hypothetical protein GHT06_015711 [Daphnia sinensis]